MTRASIELIAASCTSCMICVRECPTWCISLSAHREAVGDPSARRPRTVNVLDAFTIDWGLCMYCGICVEVCPFDALAWQPAAVAPADSAAALRHGIAELASAAREAPVEPVETGPSHPGSRSHGMTPLSAESG